MASPKHLRDGHTILDLRALARSRLSSPIFHHVDVVRRPETTAQRNIDDDPKFVRRVVDFSGVKTATHLFGHDIAWPVICNLPVDGDSSIPKESAPCARAAADADAYYCL